MEEARYGGLLDKYWFLNWILTPLGIIAGVVFLLWLIQASCPYKEVVSSCFPYNLPDWVKLASPIFLVICIVLLVIIIKFSSKERTEE